jgi:transmembrane sensor
VDIKDGAEIRVVFTTSARRVELRRGEAHFQVTRDPSRPFIVQTGGIDVRAIGTGFSVQLSQSEVAVLVTEGRVALDRAATATSPVPADNTSPGSPPQGLNPTPRTLAFVSAGNRIVVPIQTSGTQTLAAPSTTSVSSSELDELLAWRAPRVEYSGAPLSEAVAIMNSRSGEHAHLRFVIADPSISQVRVSGLFRLDKTEAFVQLLKNGFGIEACDFGDGRIVLRRAR